mmetsp:Transcript_63763/g.168800  ORF Transcript_63763/g.168800 Transcript_63763/m.168800 type:complete len:221 (-) Transcript_63763:584-1246(-)
MNLDGVGQNRDEGDKNLLLFACFPGYVEVSSRVRVQTPVAVFSRSVNASKRFLVEKQSQSVFYGALREHVLAESVLVGRNVAQCKDWGDLMLSWRHFVVHDGVGHPKLPHLRVEVHQDGLDLGRKSAKVIEALLLTFRWRSSHDSSPASNEIGTLHVQFSVDQEELLLGSVVTHDLSSLCVSQESQQTDTLAVNGIHGAEVRGLIVQSLSSLRNHHCRDE